MVDLNFDICLQPSVFEKCVNGFTFMNVHFDYLIKYLAVFFTP